MTVVKGILTMTGSMGNVSFYTRRGSDKVIMRTKGGAKKKQMENNPRFEKLRKQQKEFGGCSKFAKYSRFAFGGLHRLADYGLNPVLTGIGKNLMKLDTTSEVGVRTVFLSRDKEVLEGFSFNRSYPFNTLLRVLPRVDLNREALSAVVTFPRINTELDMLNTKKLPFFRLIIAIGSISDMAYNPVVKRYEPMVPGMHGVSSLSTGGWYSTQAVVPEHTMMAELPESRREMLTGNVSVLLSMGIEFGNVGAAGEPVEVKYAGCGKVAAIV